MAAIAARQVHLLDYGAGNVRSVRNALVALGCEVVTVTEPSELANATRLVFPGVGSRCSGCMSGSAGTALTGLGLLLAALLHARLWWYNLVLTPLTHVRRLWRRDALSR